VLDERKQQQKKNCKDFRNLNFICTFTQYVAGLLNPFYKNEYNKMVIRLEKNLIIAILIVVAEKYIFFCWDKGY
jgi:hypothetical protein